jgi:hypothetical protein
MPRRDALVFKRTKLHIPEGLDPVTRRIARVIAEGAE